MPHFLALRACLRNNLLVRTTLHLGVVCCAAVPPLPGTAFRSKRNVNAATTPFASLLVLILERAFMAYVQMGCRRGRYDGWANAQACHQVGWDNLARQTSSAACGTFNALGPPFLVDAWHAFHLPACCLFHGCSVGCGRTIFLHRAINRTSDACAITCRYSPGLGARHSADIYRPYRQTRLRFLRTARRLPERLDALNDISHRVLLLRRPPATTITPHKDVTTTLTHDYLAG